MSLKVVLKQPPCILYSSNFSLRILKLMDKKTFSSDYNKHGQFFMFQVYESIFLNLPGWSSLAYI